MQLCRSVPVVNLNPTIANRCHGAKVHELSRPEEGQRPEGSEEAKSREWNSVKYVRGKRTVPAIGVRKEHARWKRTLLELLKRADFQIVKLLIKDKILPNWQGKPCLKCNAAAKYRCSRKACQQRIHPRYLRPFSSLPWTRSFIASNPSSHTFVQSSTHLTLGVNHKSVAGMQKLLEYVRKKYVEKRCIWQEIDVG